MRNLERTMKIRVASRQAASIRRAIRDSVDVDQIVNAFMQANLGNMTDWSSIDARAWAKINIRFNSQALFTALRKLYAIGYVLGRDLAIRTLTNKPVAKASNVVDWSNWKPGNRPAALLLSPPDGLRELLDSRGLTISGINNTTMDRIGTTISRGVEQGLTPDVIARNLRRDITELLNDSQRALIIAQTEMSRAVVESNVQSYKDSGVQYLEYLVADPCDLCSQNLAASPIPVTGSWPNGNPPVHPNCMCDVAPYIVEENKPELPVAVPVTANISQNNKPEIEIIAPAVPLVPEPEIPLKNVTFDSLNKVTIEHEKLKEIHERRMGKPYGYSPEGDKRGFAATKLQPGFHDKPTVLPEKEFQEAAKTAKVKTFRGLYDSNAGSSKPTTAQEFINRFKYGEYYQGYGVSGSGTYSSTEYNTALINYAGAKKNNVMNILIPDDSNYVSFSQLELEKAQTRAALRKYDNAIENQNIELDHIIKTSEDSELVSKAKFQLRDNHWIQERLQVIDNDVMSDPGAFAALRGYDGYFIEVGNEGKEKYYIILNRSKIIVKE